MLCPDGDFTWSYRFVEAIFCGAIPVVERDCELFEGFHSRRFEEPAGDLVWEQTVAEENYQRAVARFTIPLEELDAELARLVAT